MSQSAELVETIHDLTDWSGIYIRSIVLPVKGARCEQHTHDCDHPTYCGSGSAEFWEDGALVGTVHAGGAVRVRAGRSHYFVAIESGTRLACLFDTQSAAIIKARGL